MAEEADLAWLQQWLQRTLLDPDPPAADVERVLTGSSRRSARQRLAVYRTGYRLRLLEVMRGLYPALCHLLGRALFDQFALEYLDARPSRSHSLFRLGDGFPAHLARSRPDADRAPAEREPWPDLIVDLAAFERACGEALAAPDGRRLPLAARYPVHDYAVAVRRGQDPPPPAPRPTYLILTRADHRVVARELDLAAFRALRCEGGGPLTVPPGRPDYDTTAGRTVP